MKRNYVLMCMGLMLIGQMFAQSESVNITESINVKNRNVDFWFCVCNINGSIDVEAYEGNTVEVSIEKTVNGRKQADVELGMEELQLKVSDGDDYIKLSMITPDQQMKDKDDPLQCAWDWHGDKKSSDYWYTVNFKVKVPIGISVKLSTVNKGSVLAKGVSGNVYATNVNGDVTLEGIKGDTKATTVNGKLEVSYLNMPNEFGEFKTVNGDIEIFVPSNESGVFSFQSQWGEVYSDLDFSAKLAPQVIKTSVDNGTKYKVSNSNSYQFGVSGGPTLEFETLNGDVYLRKIK